ncbi:hypothetical protein [Ketobacter alkanivorans]|uniref:DUF3800 domain-containing protein n=1 Tax=Ketobacter alkanivorans TaxID=1917421 RepID=A0A2K9LRF2_9GAMM|nr:hypothetical protein [Ketobacter alkanivorans]AUM14721.1 hypothetical protein Kalk_20815 [Ketobacter alkanivorans]
MDQLNFETDNGLEIFGPNTLVFAIDDTGNERFKDPAHPVFGLAGCGFMVIDYVRLIDGPWSNLCNRLFGSVERPLHASEIQFTRDQIEGLSEYFKSYEFFRVGVTTRHEISNETEESIIDLLGNALLARLCDVGQWAIFDRFVIIIEASDRVENRILRSLSNKELERGDSRIKVEHSCYA